VLPVLLININCFILCRTMKAAWDRIQDKELVLAAWEKVGILKAWEPEFILEAYDAHREGLLFCGYERPCYSGDDCPEISQGSEDRALDGIVDNMQGFVRRYENGEYPTSAPASPAALIEDSSPSSMPAAVAKPKTKRRRSAPLRLKKSGVASRIASRRQSPEPGSKPKKVRKSRRSPEPAEALFISEESSLEIEDSEVVPVLAMTRIHRTRQMLRAAAVDLCSEEEGVAESGGADPYESHGPVFPRVHSNSTQLQRALESQRVEAYAQFTAAEVADHVAAADLPGPSTRLPPRVAVSIDAMSPGSLVGPMITAESRALRDRLGLP
jgi:hypothetical protein